jgi:uncharacterized protein (TIGR02588 family)
MSDKDFKPRLAEWVSFGISLALILALAAYLVYEAITRNEEFLPVSVEVQTDRAAPAGGRYVLPIRVRNLGRATMRALMIRVGFERPDAPPPIDLRIEYLGEESEQLIYVYTDTDPRPLHPFAKPLAYQVD